LPGGRERRWRNEDQAMDVRRWLIVIGASLLVAGLLWPVLSRIGLGRLPGDIVIEREGARVYIPVVTCLIVSAVVSLILWLINR
jgi:prepilin signal peptidase PulO-like enzyme (type II secretory pathway)